ncbi:ABC transporter permease [Leifsonia sp. EB34]|uniref:ABC transporter permease n=1 Tax=Leifsonia sp. EB34 TaxID=3156303 RepID=UPI003511CF32
MTSTTVKDRRRPSQRTREFRQLTLLSSRELLRNSKTMFSMAFMFFFFLILIFVIDLAINGARPAPVAAVTAGPQAAAVEKELDRRGVRLADDSTATAHITVEGDRARIVLATDDTPTWKQLLSAVHAVGVPSSQILVTQASGESETDLLRINLSTTLALGFMAIAFTGTTVPLVALRKRGTLRLLGTTPVRRLSFIVAQTPVRAVIGIAEAAIIVGVAWWQGYAEAFGVVRLSVTLLLGLAMFLAFAYLFASRSSNPELTMNLTGLIPVIGMLTAGTIFPAELTPEAVRAVLNASPTAWFMQAASADIAGTEPCLPVYWLWVLMAATTVATGLVAARLFRWDQGDL